MKIKDDNKINDIYTATLKLVKANGLAGITMQGVAKEAGMSRLYGGIHYRYSIEQGFKLGERAAKHVNANVSFHASK